MPRPYPGTAGGGAGALPDFAPEARLPGLDPSTMPSDLLITVILLGGMGGGVDWSTTKRGLPGVPSSEPYLKKRGGLFGAHSHHAPEPGLPGAPPPQHYLKMCIWREGGGSNF